MAEGKGERLSQADPVLSVEPDMQGLILGHRDHEDHDLSLTQESDTQLTEAPRCPWDDLFHWPLTSKPCSGGSFPELSVFSAGSHVCLDLCS